MPDYPNPDDLLFWDEPPGAYDLFIKKFSEKFKGEGKIIALPTRTIDFKEFLK